MKGFEPTCPNLLLSICSRSLVKESGVASSGKWLLYLCMNRRAWKRLSTSSGTRESYLEVSAVSGGVQGNE